MVLSVNTRQEINTPRKPHRQAVFGAFKNPIFPSRKEMITIFSVSNDKIGTKGHYM